MKDIVERLFALHRRETALDELSPAGRAAEQRAITTELAELRKEIDRRAAQDPRCLLGRARVQIETVLAAQGDNADPTLVKLQHDLTAYLNDPTTVG